jgi:flavin reductase (DIM6/NTAB) family NADH-FMN oxidoreductase RutF
MHTFQDLDINTTDFNPFRLIGSDWAALTSKADGKINAMTVSWGGVGVLWGKNVVTVYVRKTRYTKELLDAGDYFSLTFFNENEPKYKNALKYLGAASGHDEDKIKTAGLTIAHKNRVPYIDEGNFVILCQKMASIEMPSDKLPEDIREKWYADGNDHTIYIGEIKGLYAR